MSYIQEIEGLTEEELQEVNGITKKFISIYMKTKRYNIDQEKGEKVFILALKNCIAILGNPTKKQPSEQ